MPNPTPAELIAHLETYRVHQGALAGRPLKMLPWQRRYLRAVLGDKDVGTSALSMGRGNGKSGLIAAIATLFLGPLDDGTRGEVAVFAASFNQARVSIGEPALHFLGGAADLRKRGFAVEDNSNRFQITSPSGARLSVLAADSRRAHGRPSLRACFLDEPSQWGPSGDRLLAAILTSGGKAESFRVLAIGTKSSDPEHWFSRWLSGGCDYAQLHAAGEDDPPFRAATWAKANPSMKYFPALKKAIQDDAKRAREDAGQMSQFLALRCNMGVSEVDRQMLVSAHVWSACMTDNPPERVGPAIWGIDLGTSGMSAVSAFWPLSGRLEAIAAFPEIPSLTERERLDRVGNHTYQKLFAAGELVACGSRIVDVPKLLQIALHRFGPPAVVVSDRWRAAELTQSLDAAGFPGAELCVRGMGWRDGAADCRAFVSAAVDQQIRTHRSPLLTWGLSGAVVMKDPAGNIKLQKTKHRDDAAAAAILAVAEGTRRHGLMQNALQRRAVVVV